MLRRFKFQSIQSWPTIVLLVSFLNGNAEAGNVDVTVDPRVELMTVVQLLSGYNVEGLPFSLLTQFDFKHRQTVLEYFKPHQTHEVVARFLEMTKAGFFFAPPVESMLYLSDPPELKQRLPFTDFLTDRAGGSENLARFVESLRNFAQTGRFMDFYKKQKPYYKSLVEKESDKLDIQKLVSRMESYYGLTQAGYHVILAQFIHPGGFGLRLTGKDGRVSIYAVVGPKRLEGGDPDFGSKDQYQYLILHEFGHSFVNPLVELNAAELGRSKALLEPIKKAMEDQGCADWNSCVGEHVVRAATVRMTQLKQGARAGADALNMEHMQGFDYIEPVLNELKKYESNRKRYKSFMEFFPEIIKTFDRIAVSGS